MSSEARRLRIVYVIDHLGTGGAQRQLVELISKLPKERFDARVISLSEAKKEYLPALQSAGVPVQLIAHQGKWSWHTLSTLRREFHELKPDIVHTWLFTADLYGQLAAFSSGVPHVISAMRNTIDDMPWHYRLVYRLLSRKVSRITINAEAIRSGLIGQLGIPTEKIKTIYNGIDSGRFENDVVLTNYRNELKLPKEAKVVLMTARMSPQKDYATFIEAAKKVGLQFPNVFFVLVGDGELRSEIERQIEAQGLRSQIRLLGARQDARQIIRIADICVLATHHEGCSNVIMEAMAAARPVVATNIGGNGELIINGETGYLVPPKDSEAMANRILELLTHSEQARAMGGSARKRIEQYFTLANTVGTTTALYEEMMKEGKSKHALSRDEGFLRADFRRVYEHTSYQGHLRKVLHTITDPGFQAVLGYRTARWLLKHRIPIIGVTIQRFVEVWTGISIPSETRIGSGLLIHHFGGIVINSQAVIGKNCDLHHGVTIGNRRSGGGSPKIGDRVMIGAGAKVLGDIQIGHDVEIGANAVVLEDLPDGAIAVGIPARVVRIKEENGVKEEAFIL